MKAIMLKLIAPLVLILMAGFVSPVNSISSPVVIKITEVDLDEAKKLYAEINLATVLVQAENGTGSGVVIGADLVLTAAHVVSHYDVIFGQDGRPMQGELVKEKVSVLKQAYGPVFLSDAEIIKIDPDLDLAVLKLNKKYPYTVGKLAPLDPYLYQKAWVSGHPHGITDTYITEGRVQDLWDDGFLRYSPPTTFGNSGGPVWILVEGKYMVTSIVQRVHVEGMGVAVNHLGMGALPEKVRDFMRDYNTGE